MFYLGISPFLGVCYHQIAKYEMLTISDGGVERISQTSAILTFLKSINT